MEDKFTLEKYSIVEIAYAALLHDIGKFYQRTFPKSNLTEAEKIERKKELENYYTKRLRDSIWILTQLKKAETLSYDENSVYNDYDSALRDIAYRKIPGLADIDIKEGTLTKQVDTIMNSNIYRITQNLKLNPNDDLKKLAMDIRR